MKNLVSIPALLFTLSLLGTLPLSAQKWERLNSKFQKHIEQSEYSSALDDALKMLEFSKENLDSTDTRFTMSNYCIAKACFGLGDAAVARDYVRKAYFQLVPNLAPDGNMVEVSRLYGRVETALGFHNAAERFLTEALEMSGNLEGPESRSYLLSLYAVADLKMAQAQWNEMVEILSVALQIHERNFPPDRDYALYSNYLGLLFMNSEQNQEAILYLDKCLSVYGSGVIEKDLICANAHNNLGLIHYYNTEFEAAGEHFKQAGKLYKKFSEGYSENYMMLLSNLASLYYSWGKSDRVEESYQALGAYLKSYSDNMDLPYIQALENMAHFHASSGSFKESEGYFLRAISLRRKMDPLDREAINRTFQALISVCKDFNETDKARSYRTMAEDIYHQ